ncbi:hybrid sensor histidine kinase/response regulator [Oculatella sp. LEGE 06141]|uniref:hybrid sensor histidine kinase/response regulator n=1 Tax=Oculatella sp. LEGE 06141 TaxID=1828648 RepID=UPI0018805757|nr:response regulator [Oculatella sp. LEGE 06141]MBE9180197.1 hybrid sensor histidine kinase/response regulator [Oculatella sp. LEGE 06141]
MINSQRNSILIVDDTPTNIKILFDCLKQSGFRVSVAKSGENALAKLQEMASDLVLLDVMMPGIDGFETCRRLKANSDTREIPVVFMTALSDVTDKVRGLKLGAVDYITKPIQIEEVLARINVHLALKNTRVQLTKEIAERKQAGIKLQQTLQELQQAQVQLIQSEKMSSLGQMVAGIAHEINNPINFIYGNLTHANEYVKDLLALVRLYQKYYSDPPEEIAEEIQAIELDFLEKDLVKLFQSMQVGSDRIREIIKSLRTFSRLDEAEIKAVDLHENIDSTLMILHHRLKAKSDKLSIEVVKDYGVLPKVECYPGQLNQGLMNILVNAVDVLEDKSLDWANQKRPGIISIRTQVINSDWVAIYITDTGSGMSEEVRSQLFNPFFTTKPVGQGTGLGLSISYQIIVEKHGGKLTCHSTPGEGATFVIEIPIRQKNFALGTQ